jgi:hypothetical protein
MILVRFKDLHEVLQINRKRTEKFGLIAGKTRTPDQLQKSGFSKMSSKGDHSFYKSTNDQAPAGYNATDGYLAHNHTTNRVEQHVDGKQNRAGTFHVATLSGAKNATIKAHDFYHHLITKHNMTLRSDVQSTGGKNVWNKLQQKSNVNVHGYDPKTRQGVNVHSGDEEAYHDEKYGSSKDPNDLAAKRLNLVAHKKIREI